MRVQRVGQWLYASQPGNLGAYAWAPVALVDRVTGRVYSVVPWLSNEQAAALVWGQP